MARIGFIGLGNMGGPMARNLLAKGHEVAVFDLSEAALVAAETAGARRAESALAATKGTDVVLTMLPAGAHVEAVYLGSTDQRCLLDQLAPGTLLLDCSTIAAETARSLAQAAAARGLIMLDAPVSGGVGGAEAGTLTFMVGGDGDALERARPVLEAMGKNIFHAGPAGAGQVAKMCNNMLLAVLMSGTAEALALGVREGLDPAVLSDIMKQSSGGNWALNGYNPYPGVMDGVPAARGYEGGFLVDLMLKDLGLALDAAARLGQSTPLGSLARSLYTLHKQGNSTATQDVGRLDFSSIQQLFLAPPA
jgi:3-hydroxyisobutyrate dehydrogenase